MKLFYCFVIVLVLQQASGELGNISMKRNDASTSENVLVNIDNVPSSKPNDSKK